MFLGTKKAFLGLNYSGKLALLWEYIQPRVGACALPIGSATAPPPDPTTAEEHAPLNIRALGEKIGAHTLIENQADLAKKVAQHQCAFLLVAVHRKMN
jgi:hypothetical protein